MIAMALANEPDLLIADEPTTALDVTIQAQILELLQQLQREMGMAMLLITHDLGIVRKMAERVYIMQGGKIVEEGATEEIFTAPQHAYTQAICWPPSRRARRPPPTTRRPSSSRPTISRSGSRSRRARCAARSTTSRPSTGCRSSCAQGQTLGVVGESGSGKTTLGLAILRLISSQGPDRLRRQAHRRAHRSARCGRCARTCRSSSRTRTARCRRAVGRADHRGRPDSSRRRSSTTTSGAHASARRCKEVGLDPERAGPLPARVLRRPAPAHRHRARHGAGAEVRHAGRADERARHVGAGADRRSAARPAEEARPRLPVHQPRPQGHPRAVQLRDRDAQRQGGRGRARRRRSSPTRKRTTRARCSPPRSTSAWCTRARSPADQRAAQRSIRHARGNKPRLKLYHASPSRSSIVHVDAGGAGRALRDRAAQPQEGDQRKPAYLAINPMGKVPALDDGDIVVTEVAAICCYLADTYPKAELAPPIGDKRRGAYLKWLFYGPSCVEPAMIDKALNRPPAPRSTAGWADYDTVIDVLRDAVGKAPVSARRAIHRRRRRHRLGPPLGHDVQAAARAARVRRLHRTA